MYQACPPGSRLGQGTPQEGNTIQLELGLESTAQSTAQGHLFSTAETQSQHSSLEQAKHTNVSHAALKFERRKSGP